MRAIRDAMDEAFDQRETVVYPHPAEGKALVTRAHEELSRQFGGGGGGRFALSPWGTRPAFTGSSPLSVRPKVPSTGRRWRFVKRSPPSPHPCWRAREKRTSGSSPKRWTRSGDSLAGSSGPATFSQSSPRPVCWRSPCFSFSRMEISGYPRSRCSRPRSAGP